MAIYRPIHITFWQDKFTLKLTPEQKYFYLYLMTNSKTKQCGVYELPMSVMALETGYNSETITKLIKNFGEFGKIEYSFENEEVFIKNWIKFNPVNNENIYKCVMSELQLVKTEQFINEWLNTFLKLNQGKVKKYNKEKKDYDFIDYTVFLKEGLTRGLQGACKEETKTESKSKSKTPTESPSKTETEKSSADFISDLILIFKDNYFKNKSVPYVESELDRKHMGILLGKIKKISPDLNTEQMRKALEYLFDKATEISDDNFLCNISIPKLDSQINQYLNRIKNGRAKHYTKGFGADSPQKWQRIFDTIQAG
jgi:hypothetical protein